MMTMDRSGDQVAWFLIFRRNFMKDEMNQFSELLSILDSVFVLVVGVDKRIWKASVGCSFSVASFFSAL